MSVVEPTEVGQSPEAVRAWLVSRIAHFLKVPAEEIEPDVPLADYGLESVYAFALAGEIEDTLGVLVEPTLVWDVDTVNALTAHLTRLVADQADR
ncbi:acyl carrier protein [Kitasatospora purpeofusca]|uniref:acyl carrier protein n=1 Tax=Kitasatospora purpeofusca TaxID=67352 RepID=UPI0036E0103E